MTPSERGRHTRAHILDVASESFSRLGYDATGVAEICRSAGISKGAFYHHFPSKQAVFLELLDDWLTDIDRQIRLVASQSRDVPEALRSMVDTIGRVFQAAQSQLPLFFEFLTRAARDPAVWGRTIEPYRRYAYYFSQLIEQGVREGSLVKADPEKGGQVLVSLAVGVILQGVMDPEGADWIEVAREAVEMFLERHRPAEGR